MPYIKIYVNKLEHPLIKSKGKGYIHRLIEEDLQNGRKNTGKKEDGETKRL